MENIKKKYLLIIFIVLLFCACKEKKTEIFKIHTHPSREKDRKGKGELLMVSNPPEDLGSIILFYQSEIKRLSSVKYKKKLKETDFYYLVYFKERFLFDRNYLEPAPDYSRILTFGSFFNSLSVEASHSDDVFITISFKEDNLNRNNAPITPYLYIKKWNLYYFPKGLKNNPDIHWKMYVKSERGSYYDKTLQF